MNEIFEDSYRHCKGLLNQIHDATQEWKNHSTECPICERLSVPSVCPCESGQDILFECVTKIQELLEGINARPITNRTTKAEDGVPQ